MASSPVTLHKQETPGHHPSSFPFQLLLTLYSRGNVIVLVRAFIDNRLMMILVAVYVYLKINAMKSPWP